MINFTSDAIGLTENIRLMQFITSMVKALDVDYDRLEELRNKKREQKWEFNYALDGYFPDDEPLLFETRDEAKDAMLDELWARVDRYAECYTYTLRELAEHYRSAADRVTAFGDLAVSVGRWEFWVTSNVEFEHEEELAELEAAAVGCVDRDDAEKRLMRACRQLTDRCTA